MTGKYEKSAKAYEALRKKYGLPRLDDVIVRFGNLSLHYPPKLVLYDVLWTLMQGLYSAIRTIEAVTTGSGPMVAMQEQRMLSRQQKKELNDMWRRINAERWRANRIGHTLDEKAVAEQVKRTYKLGAEDVFPMLSRFAVFFEKKWGEKTGRDAEEGVPFYE